MSLVPTVRDGDWNGVRRAIQKLASIRLGPTATPTFAGLTLTGLTATRLLASNADKALISSDLVDWVAGTANEIGITDDGDGTITISIVDPLIVAKGGTGAATLTDHGILLGSGTGAITPLGAATNGQIPIGSTGADPVLALITGTANQIVSTPGAGSITLSTPQDIHAGATPTFAGLHINSAEVGSTTLLTLESDISNADEYNEILFKIAGGKNYGAIRSHVGATNDSYMTFATTTDGGTTLVQHVTIQHDGRVIIEDGDVWLFSNNSDARYVVGDTSAHDDYGYLRWDSTANNLRLGFNADPFEDMVTIKKDGGVVIAGSLTVGIIAVEGDDVDKFLVDSSGLIKYRTGAGVLSDIGGQASGNYITALTGEVTASGPGSVAATIAANAITYAKIQNVSATDKVLGRITAGAGVVEEIACTAAGRAILAGANAAAQRTTLSLNLVENTALSTWAGTTNVTTLGTIVTGTWTGVTIAIANGGTGQETAQAAIDALTAVAGATDEHVLTKDTATGNAIFKAAGGGGAGATTALDNLAAVAINTSLISDTATTDDLGSAGIPWKDLYLGQNIYLPTTSATAGIVKVNTLNFLHSYGSESLFIGANAGNLTFTGSGRQVGIGFEALKNLTTGYYNVAIGRKALTANTTGYSNTAIGYSTLYKNTEGYSNVAIGSNALWNNLTGDYNIAIGEYALNDNTTGNGNMGVGRNALQKNTTGYGNLAFGYQALYTNVAGYENCAFGKQALYNNTTGGNYNVAFGFGALAQNTTGERNVGIGRDAGYNQQTGDDNTFIGYGAGKGGALHSKSDCIMIGKWSGFYETGSSKLFIDNALRTNEATGRITALIYGVMAAATADQYLSINAAHINVDDLPSGSDQANAGAAAGELWVTSGHATQEDNTVMRGV